MTTLSSTDLVISSSNLNKVHNSISECEFVTLLTCCPLKHNFHDWNTNTETIQGGPN